MVAFSTEFMNCGLDSAQSYFYGGQEQSEDQNRKGLRRYPATEACIGLIACVIVFATHEYIFNVFNIALSIFNSRF